MPDSPRFPDPFVGPMPSFENPRRLTPAEGLERFRQAQRERARQRRAIEAVIAPDTATIKAANLAAAKRRGHGR